MAATLTFAGCPPASAPTYTVRGTIQYADGSPVPGGSIEIESKTNSALTAVGTIYADGTFEIEGGAPAGVYRVALHPAEDPNYNPEVDDKPPPPAIGPRYEAFNTSGLELTVAAKANENLVIKIGPPPSASSQTP
jgi:hypothetical protein